MRVLILGGDGLLGHALLKHFMSKDYDVKVTLRQDLVHYANFNLFNKNNSICGIDLREEDAIKVAIFKFKPDSILNAAGIVKHRTGSEFVIPSIEINSLFPHRLAELASQVNARVVQMSTDCVFSGIRGKYSENDNPDPVDFYGRTKLLGELAQRNCITLRTSIIGLELWRKTSLIEWFLLQRGNFPGFTRAIYTGFTTMEMGRIIEMILLHHDQLSGIWHIASDSISKFELLQQISERIGREDVQIEPEDSFQCDRSLDGSRFNAQTGYCPPTWAEMLDELAEEIKQRGFVDD